MRRGTLGCHAPGPTLSLNAGLSCVMPVRAPQFSSPRFDPKTPVLWARLQCDVSRCLPRAPGSLESPACLAPRRGTRSAPRRPLGSFGAQKKHLLLKVLLRSSAVGD